MSDESASGRFTIVNAQGLHARPATKLVRLAARFPCDVTIAGADGQHVNAKSVMGVLLVCGAKGTVVEVRARGDQAQSAIDAIGKLIGDGFEESR